MDLFHFGIRKQTNKKTKDATRYAIYNIYTVSFPKSTTAM